MTITTLDAVIQYDEDGRIEGLQFDGRERAIQNWRDRKEVEEYRSLFDRLHKRNAARRARMEPIKKARIDAASSRYRDNNRDRIKRRDRDRRRAKYEADPVVNQCAECGHVWIPPYEQRVKRSRFCSRSCRNRNHARQRQRPATGMRKMDIKQSTIDYLRSHPWATLREIATAIGAKRPSLATCLCRWAKDGWVEKRGRGTCEYRLAISDEGGSA